MITITLDLDACGGDDWRPTRLAVAAYALRWIAHEMDRGVIPAVVRDHTGSAIGTVTTEEPPDGMDAIHPGDVITIGTRRVRVLDGSARGGLRRTAIGQILVQGLLTGQHIWIHEAELLAAKRAQETP